MSDTKDQSSKRGQFGLQTLMLLTALAAVGFYAYTKHLDTQRLTNEVKTLRTLLTLERELQLHRKQFGETHPQTMQLKTQIDAVESALNEGTSD